MHGNGAEGHHDHEDGEGLLYVGKRNTNHLGVGAAISLRGDFDEVQAGFQLDLSDFFFGGIQRHGSEGYLVIGGEGLVRYRPYRACWRFPQRLRTQHR